MNDFVTKMHATSGLLDEIPNGVSLAEAEFEALEYIQRFVPEGKAPLALDSRAPSASLAETLQQEPRFKRLERQLPEIASQLYREAELDANRRFAWLSQLAGKEAPAQE